MKFNKYAYMVILIIMLVFYVVLVSNSIKAGHVSSSTSFNNVLVFQGIPLDIKSKNDESIIKEGDSLEIKYSINNTIVVGDYYYDILKYITLNKYSTYIQSKELTNDVMAYLSFKYVYITTISLLLLYSFINLIIAVYSKTLFTKTDFYRDEDIIIVTCGLIIISDVIIIILSATGIIL